MSAPISCDMHSNFAEKRVGGNEGWAKPCHVACSEQTEKKSFVSLLEKNRTHANKKL